MRVRVPPSAPATELELEETAPGDSASYGPTYLRKTADFFLTPLTFILRKSFLDVDASLGEGQRCVMHA